MGRHNKRTNYCDVEVRIKTSDLLNEVKEVARSEADQTVRYLEERNREYNKSLIQAQKDIKVLQSKLLRIESKISQS